MHIPVLYHESLDALRIQSDGVYVDGTLGGAGHARGIVEQLSAEGNFIGCDVDSGALIRAEQSLSEYPCKKHLYEKNFKEIPDIVTDLGVKIDGVLLDLGWSSFQIADETRGFSFQVDGPLRMTLSDTVTDETITAWDIINTWSEETLADIFYAYGDETASRKIARAIVAERKIRPFNTTLQLADFIKQLMTKGRHTKTHPATRIFQALRITVNDEYGVLNSFLEHIISVMNQRGRIAIITFHSGEDRIVKHVFRTWADQGLGKVLTKKPIIPTDTELSENPRARSAKLRIFEIL